MALPSYTETRYRIWHYIYLTICTFVFFFLIAPLFVIFPLSFNAEEFLVFSEGMKNLDPDAFSLRWYKDMIYGTKNPWGLAAKTVFELMIDGDKDPQKIVEEKGLKQQSDPKEIGRAHV